MKKLLIALFKHETDSFCPEPADMRAFSVREIIRGEDIFTAFRGVRNEPGAFIDVFSDRKDIDLIPVLAMNAMPSGPVTADVYDYFTEYLTKALQEEKPDGVLLALHGAMVADGHDDGEGDLLEMVRGIVGPGVPVVASLDLHGNVTQKMADNADALVPYEKYPHTDMYETGYTAAKIMEGILLGKWKVSLGYRRIPYLNPMFPSDFPEIRQFHDLCKSYEEKEGVLSSRLAHGFYPSDIAEMGMSVLVVTAVPGNASAEEKEQSAKLAQSIADEAGDVIWEKHDELKRHFTSLEDALAMIDEPVDAANSGPLVIADDSDNPGGGGLCDTTHLLRAVLEHGIEGVVFGMFHDPESVKKCEEAGIGSTVELDLAGKSDPAFSGGPLHVSAYVKALTDGHFCNQDEMSKGYRNNLGHMAVVEIAGNTVLIASIRSQPYDAEIYRHCGIMPERQKAIAVKSAVHFRNSYSKFARKIVDVVLPGYVVPIPDGLPFRKWKS